MLKDVFIEVQERSKFSLDNLPAGLYHITDILYTRSLCKILTKVLSED
jgi:hypothetical protein